jgi:hypothetical protein
MLPEYDFSGGVRGKYAKRYAEGSNVIVLDPDVAQVFPNEKSVNDALRAIAAVVRQQSRGRTIVGSNLGPAARRKRNRRKLALLPTRNMGKPKVDLADRNALYDSMEGR